MSFEYVLLGLLALSPRSGYDLCRWIEIEGKFLRSHAHHSQIYRLLRRMTVNGWMEFEIDPRDGRPGAKVYRLTEAGRSALVKWARSPFEPTSRFHDPDCVIRILFSAAVDREAALAVVKTELAYRRSQIAANRYRDRTLPCDDPIPEVDQERTQAVFDLMHWYGVSAVDRWVAWLEQVQHRLETEDYTGIGETP